MMRKRKRRFLLEIPLLTRLKAMVDEWRDGGYEGVTPTTRALLDYWFIFPPQTEVTYFPCQREAMETLIFCYEVLRPINIYDLYDKVYPDFLSQHREFEEMLREEAEMAPFPKFTTKMATGSGKTWLLGMAIIWQMMNALNQQDLDIPFSYRFLVVAPGLTVLDRLLDFFLGPQDMKTQNRIREKADFRRELFVPPEFKSEFRSLVVLTPDDVRATRGLPENPFVILTNWHKLMRREQENLATEILQAEVEEEVKEEGELYDRLLKEYPDLVVFNDEAHHIHRETEQEWTEWGKALRRIHNLLREEHKNGGIILEADFSATPFYEIPSAGPQILKQHFPTIIYNYDLVQAQRDILVKQVHLEERETVSGERLKDMDYKAIRDAQTKKPVALSQGQKLMLAIGLEKLEQIQKEFEEKGIHKKPVLFVVAEENEVADLVYDYLKNLPSPRRGSYQEEARVIHSGKKGELPEDEWKELKRFVYGVDDPENPVRILISVLMLREGFDVKNICVEVVLRSAEHGWLAEQLVGRGIRPMFMQPEFMPMKREAYEMIRNGEKPRHSLDFLFIVDHPVMRKFYETLREEGHLITFGSTAGIPITGDLITIRPDPARVPQRDMAFPISFYTRYPELNLSPVEVDQIPSISTPLKSLQKKTKDIYISDLHIVEYTVTKRWQMPVIGLSYSEYLRRMAEDLLKSVGLPGGAWETLVRGLDEFITLRLFGETVVPEDMDILKVLALDEVYEYIFVEFRGRLETIALQIPQECIEEAEWRFISSVGERMMRESTSVEVRKSIYARESLPVYGGLEELFIKDVLEPSPEVKAFVKLDRRIGLKIPYLAEERGRKRLDWYIPDFLVKTDEKMYVIETKGEFLLDKRDTFLKSLGGRQYCEKASRVKPLQTISQPQKFEYILIADSILKQYESAGFPRIVEMAKNWMEEWSATFTGRLFS